jgi:adenylate kinase family enzyme
MARIEILIRGATGAGKSTIAAILAEALEDHVSVLAVDDHGGRMGRLGADIVLEEGGLKSTEVLIRTVQVQNEGLTPEG